jgi:hypothetical protein
MKKPVNLILSVLFVCMLASCVGATPKLVGPGGKIGDMTVQQHAANELMRDISIYCSEYRYMGLEPGTQTSDCDVPMVPSLQIGSSWEAKDATILESNWRAIEWELYVDGYQIDLSKFELWSLNPMNVRGWTIDLVNLSPGKHTIRNLWRSEQPIDDGFHVYPPGTYESIVNFTVADE